MTGAPDANMPLAGFTILDLTQVYQGPYATMMAAKAGAAVIKIEPPGGEALRLWAPPGKTSTFAFAMMNANKHSVTLNLKSSDGRALLHQLVERGDALVENYAPGVMERLGVGWRELHAINPRLVYVSGTGFGLSGPDRDNLAMDFTVQAASGLMDLTGYKDSPPLRSGAPLVDILSGTHLYAGLVTALLERARTGRGRLVEVAMIETVYAALANSLEQYHNSGHQIPPRTGNNYPNFAKCPYNAYQTKDGYVTIVLINEMQWQNLLRAMEREDLSDDARFLTNDARVANREETEALISAWALSLTKAEIFAATSKYRVPCAPVRNIAEIMFDPHMHERGMLEMVNHEELGSVVMPNSPLRFHCADKVPTRPSPRLGEHNREIYQGWLGLSERELERLKQSGVI